MLEIMMSTPAWVYAVFAGLVYYGIKACFEHTVSKRSLQLLPAVFVSISLASLNTSIGVLAPVACFVLGFLVGLLWARYFDSHRVVRLEGEKLILQGTVKPLVLYLGYFALRYCEGYQTAVYPELADELPLIVLSGLGVGLCNGLLFGRSIKLSGLFKAGAKVGDISRSDSGRVS